jgi:hypothetical protein
MFKLFKKNATNEIMIAEVKGKTTKQIIEEIHEDFYTEVDKLLAEAKVSNSLDTTKQELLDKCERLKALGFTKTKEMLDAEEEISRLKTLKLENEKKKNLIEAINYFNIRYPNYKFITEDSVKKICTKYNLIYGSIDRYVGTVPDINLKHIEEFKIIEDDECYFHTLMSNRSSNYIKIKYESKKQHFERLKNNIENNKLQLELGSFSRNYYQEINKKCPLEIAAPIKDFNMEGMEVKDLKISKIEIPDPVVLKPIIYKNQKCYLIVTAWGDEASDELVVNQNQN